MINDVKLFRTELQNQRHYNVQSSNGNTAFPTLPEISSLEVIVSIRVGTAIYLIETISLTYTVFFHTGYGYLRYYPVIEIVILPMLSDLGYHVRAIHCLYCNSRTCSSSDVIVMYVKVTSSYVASHVSTFSESSGYLFYT